METPKHNTDNKVHKLVTPAWLRQSDKVFAFLPAGRQVLLHLRQIPNA
jgi:hypothetical protein